MSYIMKGRPAKGSEGNEHVIMQMRKNITMNGSKPIKFSDGQSHTIPSGHAAKIIDHYDSLKKPSEKEEFQKYVGQNHREMSDWIGGKKWSPSGPSAKPAERKVNNDEIFGHKSLRESSTLRTIKSLKHRQQINEQREERAKFRRRLADIIASV